MKADLGWLEQNQIDNLPNSIGNLSMLSTLRIEMCQVSEIESCTIPETIGNLSSLRNIYSCLKDLVSPINNFPTEVI